MSRQGGLGLTGMGLRLINWRSAIGRSKRKDHRILSSHRRLHVETLEDRRMLATFTVTSNADSGAGSLREAIDMANNLAGADQVQFNTTGTIALTSGELLITEALTITGPGQGLLTIDAMQNSRVINFTSSPDDLTLEGLTITGGQATGDGGGIRFGSSGTLTLTSSKLSGNSTVGAVGRGGGIFALGSGSVTLISSTLSDNSTAGYNGEGGGISAQHGDVSLTNSTVSDNTTAGGSSHGGGIFTSSGSVSLTNSTLSGNRSAVKGGGIYTNSGSIVINSSTVAFNNASFPSGRGIYVADTGSNPPITIKNSIVAANPSLIPPVEPDIVADPDSTLTINYSLIGDADGLSITGNVGNQTGSGSNSLDPKLAPLADNGGPTPTHALMSNSPAIDRGNPALTFDPAQFDQRGMPFVRVFDGDDDSTSRVDMGAYERNAIPFPLIVSTTEDSENGNVSPGDLSLREAIVLADHSAGADTITFDAALFAAPQTIALAEQLPAIVDDLTIIGPGQELLTIDGGHGTDGLFNTGDGFVLIEIDQGNVSISGLTLTGADNADFIDDDGGAISNTFGNVTVEDSTLISNATSGNGGAISNDSGQLTLSGSTITGNSSRYGGGIHNRDDGVILIADSIITRNSASRSGGGISNGHSDGAYGIVISGTTISGNTAILDGGGVFNQRGAFYLYDSTVAYNSARDGGGIYHGRFAYENNLIANTTITGNAAASRGGGLFAARDLTLSHSTISGNFASTGGGIYNFQGGYAGPFISVLNSTITENSATVSGGGVQSSGVELAAFSSIIANNLASADANIGGDLNQFSSNNVIDVDPRLGPLADNGGPTLTHAILPGSPAINAGDLPNVSDPFLNPEFDQRGAGFPRVLNGQVDVGALESNETLPPPLVVDSTADIDDGDFSPGNLSLREAIRLANENIGNDTIEFDAALFGSPQTINLLPSGGELHITESVTITGTGPDMLTLDAGNGADGLFGTGDGFRLFRIDDGTTGDIDVSLSGLTITGGDASNTQQAGSGGAIFSSENLILSDSEILDNGATSFGGGVYNFGGILTVSGSTFAGNKATLIGGGVFNTAGGTANLTGSTLSGNMAANGAGLYSKGTSVVDNSSFTGNLGTAIHNGDDAQLDVVDSTISGNTGRGITNDRRSVLTITRSVISGHNNRVAIYNNFYGDITILKSTLSGNLGDGAILNREGTITISRSTLSDNYAEFNGGAIRNTGTLTLVNSTISNNTAEYFRGGGIHNSGSLTITNSTITKNTAGIEGGGIYNNLYGTATINNTIVAGNSANSSSNVSGTLTGSANNLIDVNPMLGPLSNNGGPTTTKTHALLPGSPAIDAGNSSLGGIGLSDQRDQPFVRNFDDPATSGSGVDIGAFELQTLAGPYNPGDYNFNGRVDAADYTLWFDQLGRHVAVFSGADGDGSGVVDELDYDLWKMNFGNLGAGAISSQAVAVAQIVSDPPLSEQPAPVSKAAELVAVSVTVGSDSLPFVVPGELQSTSATSNDEALAEESASLEFDNDDLLLLATNAAGRVAATELSSVIDEAFADDEASEREDSLAVVLGEWL